MELPNENLEAQLAMEGELEKMQQAAVEAEMFGLSSDVMSNLKEAETEAGASAELSPEALERMEGMQDAKAGGIIQDVVETVVDVIEDIIDGIKDFFDGPNDKPEVKPIVVPEFTLEIDPATNPVAVQEFDPVSTPEVSSDFNMAEFRENVDSAAKEWHVQIEDYSCAIACQQFIINEFKDLDVTEQELINLSWEQGWYEGYGTAWMDIGNLLEAYGIDTDVNWDADFQDLEKAVQNGDRAIIGVQNMALFTEWCDGYPMYSANHAVEVIAVDRSDPENVKVIVNDPGVWDGCAKVISYENFMDAWGTSGGYMLTAHRD